MTDADTQAAIDALTYRLRKRDAALRGEADAGEPDDPEVFALEYLTAMRGKGWRPTPAEVSSWKDQAHGGDGLPVGQEARDLVAAYRAKAAAKPNPGTAA